MSLSTPADLRGILEVPTTVEDPQLQAYLDDANLIVTENLAGKGLSSARLKTIEKYIAAHLAILLIERGGLTSSRDGDAQDNYTVLSPMGNGNISGFQLTRYGQQAIVFDTSGTLKAMSKQSLPAQFRVIGTAEQNGLPEDYW